MPTFTNPNNVAIVCSVPPNVTGVFGNFYLDRDTGREVMMVDATPMRAETILAAFSKAGASVVAITAKGKLRKALGNGIEGIAFSAEKADLCSEEDGISSITELLGRGAPNQYSADLSLFVLDAGIALFKDRRPHLLYLSLSDYVQHAYAPETLRFMREVDYRVGELGQQDVSGLRVFPPVPNQSPSLARRRRRAYSQSVIAPMLAHET